MNCSKFKDLVSHRSLADTVVAFWSSTQEVTGSKLFTVITNIFYLPQRKVMFSETSVSNSVHKGRGCPTEGVSLHVLGGLPLEGSVPLLVLTSSGDHCSSRYTSYWNEFLL